MAERRGRVDIAIASLLSDAGLRRSEAAAVTWADIARAADGSGRVTVRRSKTDQAGQGAILYVTAATMAALAAIRQGAPDAAPVFGLSVGQIGRRIAAATVARSVSGRCAPSIACPGVFRTTFARRSDNPEPSDPPPAGGSGPLPSGRRGESSAGRVGLAVRMMARGAPTHAVMLAGRWQGAGMVARYL